MSKLAWYRDRLRAMSVAEVASHARKKFRQLADARPGRHWSGAELETSSLFPTLPSPNAATEPVRAALRQDREEILAGRWRAFGHLDIRVDDPPHWQRDYLAGMEPVSMKSSFRLDHRRLPEGADVKLIWELSRWQQLVRLAQAAFVLGDKHAAHKCREWLRNWVRTNPPFQGWNWTSALESGMRLIQFTWMDPLLFASDGDDTALRQLRRELLPAHVHYTWRYRTFGSSANNHLLGELAGLILATTRWPALAEWCAPLETLHRLWEREVLAQFAEDGGNREQALNYHLFSWELCWQTRAALAAAGVVIAPEVEDRLSRATDFFVAVQTTDEPWDYGDSDNATVTPFFLNQQSAVKEWHDWLSHKPNSPGLCYWLGRPPSPFGKTAGAAASGDWFVYPDSGIAFRRSSDWRLRWDLSPLGYLSTAAHGHLDALHLSMWVNGHALTIDPGTGAYYGDPRLRAHLASWAAHNGPRLADEDFPRRLGSFLWSARHDQPRIRRSDASGITAGLQLPTGMAERSIARIATGAEHGWTVDDAFRPRATGTPRPFLVGWQFAPGWRLEMMSEREFRLTRGDTVVRLCLDVAWSNVKSFADPNEAAAAGANGGLIGVCSPGFRQVMFGPMVLLTGQAHNSCVFRTTFLASAHS